MSKLEPADKFSQESYDQSNDWAMVRGIKHFKNLGWEIVNSEENYGVDLEISKNDKKLYVELEIKDNTSFSCVENFPYPTVSFLERKKKWRDLPFIYMIICRETEYYVACSSKIIFNPEYYTQKPVHSRYKKNIDNFYHVPKNKCYFNKLLL